ncbi:MAG: hypothetical protein ACE3JK_00760 [Sporolactobacillus sp.]
MSFLGIIIGVGAFVLYIARSVEKQNEEERGRQARQQRRGPASSRQPVNSEPAVEARPNKKRSSPGSSARKNVSEWTMEAMNDQWQKKYQEAREKRKQGADAPEMAVVPVAANRPAGERPAWMNDRQMVRRAFLFSECIGKPRAISPHPYFKKK